MTASIPPPAAAASSGLPASQEQPHPARLWRRDQVAAGSSRPARYCNPKIRGINKVDGLPFRVRDIPGKVQENVAKGMNKM